MEVTRKILHVEFNVSFYWSRVAGGLTHKLYPSPVPRNSRIIPLHKIYLFFEQALPKF